MVKAKDSLNLADGTDTTQQIGSGTFISNNDGMDESNGQAGGTVLDFAGSDEVELEYSLKLVGTDVAHNDTLQLRIKGLDTYTNTQSLTVQDCNFQKYHCYRWITHNHSN